MKKRTYDFAFGLGIVCSCSETLRKAGLQYLSFPYDWITIATGDPKEVARDVLYRAEQICDEFSTWFRPDDFVFKLPLLEIGKDQYVNTRLNLLFNHDFLTGVPYEKAFPIVTERYRRRGKRLIEGIRAAKRILVLHVDCPNKDDRLSPDVARQAQKLLAEHFPGKTFDFYLLSYEKGRAFEDRVSEDFGEGLSRVTFDYRDYTPGKQPYQVDLETTGGLLARQFKVRDYRTPEEKRKFREQKWAKRCKKAGVANRWEYHKAQVAAFFHGKYNVLADLVARLKRRKYDQIDILGFNCEAAFRFVCKWDFLDSSLLAWTNSLNLDTLTRALANFDGIGAGEMAFHVPSRMWQCQNSKIYFHGKMRAVAGSPAPTEAEKAADLTDLRGRIAHLKEKFRTRAANEKSSLFVYKLSEEDQRSPDLAAKLEALEKALENLGARNFHLLVVCERACRNLLPAGPRRSVRSVLKFNPGNDVTSRRAGDPAGWKRIFSEFAPARVLKRTHKFKYE